MKFRDTLSETDRHFVERIESFGDIVVGFSLSLLALQLVAPTTDSQVFGNPLRFVLFFGTFALVVSYWLRFTKIMAIGFRPTRIDLAILFIYLAFVALLPYSLQVYVRVGRGQLEQSLALYLGVFIGVTITSLALTIRGARNAWTLLDDAERTRQWRSSISGLFVLLALCAALACDLTGVPIGAFGAFLVMALCIRLTKIFYSTPRPRLLGIQETA